MKLKLLQIDAFADRVFDGNPAAVCELAQWLPDATLQAIAAENNLSETAYYLRRGDGAFDLRWFTPAVEVDLCGHATLAAAFAIFRAGADTDAEVLRFHTRSGELRVRRSDRGLSMDFPSTRPQPIDAPRGLLAALGLAQAQVQAQVLDADDYIVVVEDEDIVAALAPDFAALRAFPRRGVAVTAPGRDFDFVSRWFGPRVGVDEDPVTGSAHTWLAPYWSQRLGKPVLRARQGGARRGTLTCEIAGDRVVLSGSAVLYLSGEIEF